MPHAEEHSRPAVILVSESAMLAEGLRRILGEEFNFVAIVESPGELLKLARLDPPDIALVDLPTAGLSGAQIAHRFAREASASKLVFLGPHAKPEAIREFFAEGASGYVLKNSGAKELTDALHQIMNGSVFLSSELSKDVLPMLLQPRTRPLTERQREVLRLLAEGRSAKEAASLLRVSVKTIRFHRTAIMKKLGLHTTVELLRYALDHGIAL